MQPCNPDQVRTFDYGRLSEALRTLSKPAQRALVNNGIYTPRDLARWTRTELAALHGIGPSSFPKLEQILKSQGLAFR